MPVSTTAYLQQGQALPDTPPRAKRCKLCDESSHRSDPSSGYWQLQLDRDLVDTISAIYPEWFKDRNMADDDLTRAVSPLRESPPKAIIDTSPILMDQNKESLKVKLLLRRPLDQLVAQGIMPPHGQRRSAERAKTGDILKAKIQQRPSRHELERRHILEADALHADPSLAEKQRMLKKARLADQLNDQLSHRPGPLELIQKNILHTEEPIEEAVKTGKISYKATSEGALKRPQHPQNYVNPEEDSQGSSEGDVSSDVLETAAKSAGIVVSLIKPDNTPVLLTPIKDNNNEIVFADLCRPLLSSGNASSPASLSTLSPLSSVASPVPCQPSTPVPPPPPPPLPRVIGKSDAPGKDKNRKKSKSKSTPKARTIKFHEYKGPPSAQKSSCGTNSNGETSYDLLLKQQTLLLQFQLQLQHKFPQIILPANQKGAPVVEVVQTLSPAASPATSETSTTKSIKLEDMKVSDLKAELKRRSLPVSGCKPQLIERLKSFNQEIDHSSMDLEQSNSPSIKEELHSEMMDISNPTSPAIDTRTNEDLVREQQRQIEELQRELTLSQLKLQALNNTRSEPTTQLVLQKHLQAKQQQQNIAQQMKQLQAETKQINEEQQRIQQQQHIAFQNRKNSNNLDQKIVMNGNDLVYQLMQCKTRANSLPNFVLTDVKREMIKECKPPPEIKVEFAEVQTAKPPPLYEEATKKKTVKSQIVDDVLEILIKNGELPASAASYPSTPGSAGTKAQEPIYPNNELVVDNMDNTPLAGIDPTELLNSLDNMDFNQLVMDLQTQENNNEPETMDTDEWLEALMPHSSGATTNYTNANHHGYDPLLGMGQDPFDPFNLEEEFRSPLSWDKVDYAT